MMIFDNSKPIYIQIGVMIEEQILSGALASGEKLPSVREYAVIFEVSPLTVHRALQYLEQERIIVTKKGIGSFVQSESREHLNQQMVHGEVLAFIAKMRNCGVPDGEIAGMVQDALRGGTT